MYKSLALDTWIKLEMLGMYKTKRNIRLQHVHHDDHT